MAAWWLLRRSRWWPFLSRPITFRGWARARRRRVAFADRAADAAPASQSAALNEDVRDAVTGQPIRAERGLQQCTRCRMFYQASSVEFIRRQNGGRCIGCGSASLAPSDGVRMDQSVTPPRADSVTPPPRADGVTTLADYRRRVDDPVVFEGRCVCVLTSRSGTAFAVMFEPGTWTEGFKLVVPTAYVEDVGGAALIRSLAGRMIRAQGVVTHSPIFGYEITISRRAQILGVWP